VCKAPGGGLWNWSFPSELAERYRGGFVSVLYQQTLSRIALPAVGLSSAATSSAVITRVETWNFSESRWRKNPVDAAFVGAGSQVQSFLEIIRNPLRMFQYQAIHVRDVSAPSGQSSS